MAAAETVVPPGNSAAAQYTEAFPTSGGEAEVNREIDASNLEPSKVLGKNKAHALESQGNDGKQVAIITAVTGPQSATPESQPAEESPQDSKHKKSEPESNGGGGSNQPPSNSGGGGGQAEPNPDSSVTVSQPSGSSGLGEVLGQATGANSGQLGLLLPLILIGTVVVSLIYASRQRRAHG